MFFFLIYGSLKISENVFPNLWKRLIVLIWNCPGCFLCDGVALKNWKILWVECCLNYSFTHSFIYSRNICSALPCPDPEEGTCVCYLWSWQQHQRWTLSSFCITGNRDSESLNKSQSLSGRARTWTRGSQTLFCITKNPGISESSGAMAPAC